jgi:hypothetical protein
LAERLNSPELRQLKQRVTLRYRLRHLSLAESLEYIQNRLQIVGGNPAIFTRKAVETIYLYSRGIPRIINVLCDNGLLTAYALARRDVDASIIREVAEDLNLQTGSAVLDSKERFAFNLEESNVALNTNGDGVGEPRLPQERKTIFGRLKSAIERPLRRSQITTNSRQQ